MSSPCLTHTFHYLDKTRTIFTRGTALWYYRLRGGGQDQWVCLATADVAAAEKNARDLILAAMAGGDRFAALREATRLRRIRTVVQACTVAELEKAYRAATAGRLDPSTISANIGSLLNILRKTTGQRQEPDKIPLNLLNGDFVHQFKQKVLTECASLDEAMRRRRLRTANSLLRQARSLFTVDMQNAYRRDHGLVLPAGLPDFLREPAFKEVAKQRDDYRMPPDHLIAKTFAELEKLRDADRNGYLALWLALGFGLRKEEIAGVRGRNFLTLQGQPALELEEVWRGTRCKNITKNGDGRPRILCTNGAWAHLQPFVEALAPGAYLLGGSVTERTDTVFRNVAAWLRGQGWETQKAIHEFRAYAGCQVAMRDGIFQCSKWLRHSSVTITERHYARYVSQRITSAALQLPHLEPGNFTPQVVSAS